MSAELGIDVEHVRLVDHDIAPGVVSEEVRAGDEWPALRRRILEAEILVIATPTWLGQPSSVAKRALERMDALLSETDDGTPVAMNRVAGVIVTGNEDGAHHCIAEISGALIESATRSRARPGPTGTRAQAPGRRSMEPPPRFGGPTRPGTAWLTCSLTRRRRWGPGRSLSPRTPEGSSGSAGPVGERCQGGTLEPEPLPLAPALAPELQVEVDRRRVPVERLPLQAPAAPPPGDSRQVRQ